MRIGLDARLTRQMSVGMKAYAREVVARLPRVAPDLSFVTFEHGGNFGWNEQVRLPLAMRRARLDAAHFLSLYMPLFPPRPFAITIHDLIHLHFPHYFKSKVGLYYTTAVRSVCARASRVIVDDPRTIEDLERFLGVDPAKVRVVPLGVDGAFRMRVPPRTVSRPYLLYVGNHRAHKSIDTLLEAWQALERPIDLYLTGADDFGGELQRLSNDRRRIVVRGDPTDEVLAAWYAGAIALVHPALREGFGLPMLEAMAVGCPVVACEDAVPAVLAPAALTFPPRDASALRAALERLLDDGGLRAELVKKGTSLAASLTWDACALATAAIYREMLEERR